MSIDLAFDDAQAGIATALTQFCRQHCDADTVKGLAGKFPDALWRELADFGVLAAATPEGDGGPTEVIAAMNRMKEIPPGIRRSVLEEVEGILNRQAGLPPRETTSRREDLFGRLEPYLPDHIGPIDPDWDDGETDRPSDDSPPPWQPS